MGMLDCVVKGGKMKNASGHELKINRYVIDREDSAMLAECYDTELEVLQAAIDLASERAKLWIVPCTWQATRNTAGQIVVLRYHR